MKINKSLIFVGLILLLIPSIFIFAQLKNYLRLNKSTISLPRFFPGEVNECSVENNSGKDLFIPFKTAAEWQAFKNNLPSNVSINCSSGPCSNPGYCAKKLGLLVECTQKYDRFFAPDGCNELNPECVRNVSTGICEQTSFSCDLNETSCKETPNSLSCDWYLPNTMCITNFGSECYDPNLEICCNQTSTLYPIVCPASSPASCNSTDQTLCRFIRG